MATTRLTRRTYQNYSDRVFTAERPEVVEAIARAFSVCATDKIGAPFIVSIPRSTGQDNLFVARVDMTHWPLDRQFGPWFEQLMNLLNVRVED